MQSPLGGLALGGVAPAGGPPFSGFFAKDEILAFVASRDGGPYWIFSVVGYAAAFITAIYTFRLIFRVFLGDPVPQARELEDGHLHHPEQHINPTDGEVEDTSVGFPGPEHYVAEREMPMKVAMGVLAILAAIGGLALLPYGAFAPLEHFLEPSFADSELAEQLHPSDGLTTVGLLVGASVGLLGILVAYTIWVRRPGTSAAVAARFPRVHALLVNQWYFDQILDTLFVRPAAWFGRWASAFFERVFVQGTLVGGPTGLVRAGSAAVRAVQTGLLRSYVALLLLGMTAVGLYFLLQS